MRILANVDKIRKVWVECQDEGASVLTKHLYVETDQERRDQSKEAGPIGEMATELYRKKTSGHQEPQGQSPYMYCIDIY